MKFLRKSPLSPFILTLYAVFSLWVVNYDQTPFFSIVRVLVLTLVIALITLLIFRITLRDWVNAGLAASLALLIFFIYGHVYNLILGTEIAGFMIGRHRYLLVVVGILFGVGLFFIIRKQKKAKEINLWVNIVTLLMMAMVGVQICVNLVNTTSKKWQVNQTQENALSLPKLNGNIGDVYYILMDGYSRQDLLLTEFGYDNSEFINELTKMGFIIPDCALSNYDNTAYSMASALNMNYLGELNKDFSAILPSLSAPEKTGVIRFSEARLKFEELGFDTITFKSPFPFIDISDSDIYYDAEKYQRFYNKIESINFQDLFFRTTVMRIIIEAQEKNPARFEFLPDSILWLVNPRATIFFSREYRLYDQYQLAFAKLKELPSLPQRKFIYAHLLVTHTPFVYQNNGDIRKTFEDGPAAYLDQITYANQQLIEIVRTIIKESKKPPVIIIQADHSIIEGGEDHLKILNAYYLPEGGNGLIYPTITPVNTFRLILSYYFGYDYPLLPDHSYLIESANGKVLSFNEVSVSCVKKETR